MTQTVEEKVNELSDRNADTTDSDIRYLAYGARLRTALRASTRYIAYVRDPNFMFFRSSLSHLRMYTDKRRRGGLSTSHTSLDCDCSIRSILVIPFRVTIFWIYFIPLQLTQPSQ